MNYQQRKLNRPPSPPPLVLGTGATFGHHYTTEEMIQAFHKQRGVVGDKEYDREFVTNVFSKLQFDSHSVMLDKEDIFRRFDRSEYIQHRRDALTNLAEQACRKALQDWGGDPSKITHLYWGTMTGGMDSPTIDIALTRRLGLRPDVKRTNIEGMGCLTGFKLLNLSTDAAISCPDNRILVIEADLRSLIGNSLPDRVTRSDIVSAALFRDAASAAVVGGNAKTGETSCYEILAGKSLILGDESKHLVDYVEMDDGSIRLHLEKNLPDAIEQNESNFVSSLLQEAKAKDPKLTIPSSFHEFDIVCHTGGPKILQKVGEGLGLDDKEHLKSSWKIMKAHGNLSGASNLAVLDEQNKSAGGRDWIICLSMGPGVAMEGLVMRRPQTKADDQQLISHHELTPLGDLEVGNMIKDAIDKKVIQKHKSTNYLGQWSWLNWLGFCLVVSTSLVLWASVFRISPMILHAAQEVDTSLVVTAAVLAPAAIVTTSIWICLCFRVEQATTLSFLAITSFHAGALLTLIAGVGVWGQDGREEKMPFVTFLGTSCLALGMVVFSYTSVIYQDWQYMVQNPIVAVAFLLRTGTAVVWMDETTVDDIDSILRRNALWIDVAATVLFAIGLCFGLSKSYKKTQAPWLTPPNYQFFGILLFGIGEVFANGAVVIMRVTGSEIDSPHVSIVASISQAVLSFASLFLLLDTARTAFNLEKTLDYTAPSTVVLSTTQFGLETWSLTSILVIFSGVLYFASIFDTSTQATESLRITARSLPLLAFLVTSVGLLSSWRFHDHPNAPFQAFSQVCGTTVLGVGFGFQTSLEPLHQTVGYILCMLGCTIMAATFIALPFSRWSFSPLKPWTWPNLLHSNNFFLLGFVYLFVSSLLSLFDEHGISAVFMIKAGLGFGLHNVMSWYVFSMTHGSNYNTKDSVEQDDECGSLDESSDDEFDGVQPPDVEASVLIVGAGPTGLLLGSILGKHGVKTVIVEQREGPVTDARWTVINSAALEQLRKVLSKDIFDELRQRAMPDETPLGSMLVSGMAHEGAEVIQQATTPSRNKLMEDLGNIDDLYESRSLGSKHSQELPIRANQSHQEAVLKKQVERYPCVRLMYGHELVDLKVIRNTTNTNMNEPKVEYVLSKIRSCHEEAAASQDSFIIRSTYIVGCDGPKSLVASKLKMAFDGFLNLGRTRSILVRAPGLYKKVLDKVGATFMYQILRPKFGFAGVVAADPKEEMWNFLMMFGSETRKEGTTVKKICSEFLGTENVEPIADRFWFWNFFITRNFRKGPGFIAGDAAHSWPPFGATGGNQGYADAANLGWKLVQACQDTSRPGAYDALLESYNSERRLAAVQTALFVLNHSPRPDLLTKLLPVADWNIVRRWFSTLWLYLNSGKNNANHFSQPGTQLGTKYSHSQVVCDEERLTKSLQGTEDPFCEYTPVIQNGARLPFVNVVSVGSIDRGSKPLFSLIASSGFTLLVVAEKSAKKSGNNSTWLEDLIVEHMEDAFASENSTFQVEYISKEELDRIGNNDRGARGQAAALLAKERLVLARPDHYVAWHWTDHIAKSVMAGRLDPSTLCHDVASSVLGTAQSLAPNASHQQRERHCRKYQQWLSDQFMHHLRPFMFNFPNAIPIQDDSKAGALNAVKSFRLDRANNAAKSSVFRLDRIKSKRSPDPFPSRTNTTSISFGSVSLDSSFQTDADDFDVTTANHGTRKDYVLGASFNAAKLPPKEKEEAYADAYDDVDDESVVEFDYDASTANHETRKEDVIDSSFKDHQSLIISETATEDEAIFDDIEFDEEAVVEFDGDEGVIAPPPTMANHHDASLDGDVVMDDKFISANKVLLASDGEENDVQFDESSCGSISC